MKESPHIDKNSLCWNLWKVEKISPYVCFILAESLGMSKATKVILSLSTKHALSLFYMRVSGFRVAFKKKKKNVKKIISMIFFYWLKVSSDLFLNFNP